MKIFISVFLALILIIFASKFKINVISLSKRRKSLKIHFNVTINFYLFGIINIKLITLKEDGIYFLFFKIPYQKINIQKYNMQILKEKKIFEALKILKLHCEKTNIKFLIGTEDAMINALLVSTISAIFAIVSGKYNEKINRKKYYYEIIPMYNSNILEFEIQTQISVKMLNIIKSVLFVTKNEKSQELPKESLAKI